MGSAEASSQERRRPRRERVRSEMERRGVDVLVLGRRGNAKYVGGHRLS